MSDEKEKDGKSYFGRGRDIDSAVEAAEGTLQDRDTPNLKRPKASDNPYPEGSYRAKVWERNRQDGKYDEK